MSLHLQSITFNHSLTSADTSALNIRKNKDYEILLPEYDTQGLIVPTLTHAAYAIRPTRGKRVFIRMVFSLSTPSMIEPVSFTIKADGGGILGKLDPFTVTFASGQQLASLDIPLSHRTFEKVGLHDVTWDWWLETGIVGAWQKLASTRHRIYLLLDLPAAPWSLTYASKTLPWTDLLDHVCRIASGGETEEDVALDVIRAINEDYKLRYESIGGGYKYIDDGNVISLKLEQWIERVLNGNPRGTGTYCPNTAESYDFDLIVACADTSVTAAVMASVVGAKLESHAKAPFGYLHYVEPVGRGKCNNPFYLSSGCRTANNKKPAVGKDDARSYFDYHAFAMLNGQTIYDACMRRWDSPTQRAANKALAALVFILVYLFSGGRKRPRALLHRARGLFVGLKQPDYEKEVVDHSVNFESAKASTQKPDKWTIGITTT